MGDRYLHFRWTLIQFEFWGPKILSWQRFCQTGLLVTGHIGQLVKSLVTSVTFLRSQVCMCILMDAQIYFLVEAFFAQRAFVSFVIAINFLRFDQN